MFAGAAVEGFPCAALAAQRLHPPPRHPLSPRLLASFGRNLLPTRRWRNVQESHCRSLIRKVMPSVMACGRKDLYSFDEIQKALLVARNSGAIVFLGTFGPLAVMTIISVVIGRTFHYIDGVLPSSFGGADLPIDDIAAVCLLTYFGVFTLLDAASTEGLKAQEEQKEAELAASEFSGNGAGIVAAVSTAASTFLLVFVAEWGDKSFFSTIALAAASSPLGVIGGALAGHAVATLVALTSQKHLKRFMNN